MAARHDRSVDAGLKVTTVTGPPAPPLDGSVAAAAAKIRPSVVTVYVGTGAKPGDGSNPGNGSGTIIRSDGYILTNDDVIAPAPGNVTVVLSDGRAAVAKVVGRDSSDDLAVLRISGLGSLTAATFANSTSVSVGQTVIAVGAPQGLSGTVTEGIVSGLARPVHTARGSVFRGYSD